MSNHKPNLWLRKNAKIYLQQSKILKFFGGSPQTPTYRGGEGKVRGLGRREEGRRGQRRKEGEGREERGGRRREGRKG